MITFEVRVGKLFNSSLGTNGQTILLQYQMFPRLTNYFPKVIFNLILLGCCGREMNGNPVCLLAQ